MHNFLIKYAEADSSSSWPALEPPKLVTTASSQMRLTRLRAGQEYEIFVASNGTDGVRRSEWVVAPLLRTERASHAPEPPLQPLVLPTECHLVRLRLPPPPTGCRSPAEASLQYLAAQHPAASLGWQDYEAPLVSRELELAALPSNQSYRFRLIAHNAAGRSHPGAPSAPLHVCPVPSTSGKDGADVGRWSSEILPSFALHGSQVVLASLGRGVAPPEGSSGAPTAFTLALALLMLLLLLAALLGCRCLLFACCSPAAARRPRGKGGRYHRAATAASDDEDDEGDEPLSAVLAWSRSEAMLCVQVYVPASRAPVQIEMSTVGVTTCARLLRQLLVVVSEVSGRHSPPLVPEELSVVYETRAGMKVLHSGCALEDVFGATRVVASIRDAAAPAAKSALEAAWPTWRTAV